MKCLKFYREMDKKYTTYIQVGLPFRSLSWELLCYLCI